MKKGIYLELYRAFKNPLYWISLFAGCVITVAHFIVIVLPETQKSIYIGLNMEYPTSVFNRSFPFNSTNYFPSLFYYAVPLLATLPHAVSYFTDLSSGYIKNVYTRMKKRDYLFGKYLAVFLTAGTVCVLPVILNVMLTMTVFPAAKPYPGLFVYPITGYSWMNELFFTVPFLYFGLYMLIDFIMAGAFACMALGVSRLVGNRYILLFIPFLLFFVIQAAVNFTGLEHWGPFYIMNPAQPFKITTVSVVGEAGILLTVGLISYIAGGKKDAL